MEEERLIAKIAYMYYMEKLDLKEIGSLLGVSYATVSRLLKKGRENGIIKVVIDSRHERDIELESEIKKKLNLKEVFSVYVSDNYSYDHILNLLGIQTANYLTSILENGDNLGISFGNTIYNVVNNLKKAKQENVNLIQMMGHTPWFPVEFSSFSLIRKLQDSFRWSYNFINSVAILDDKETKKILIKDKSTSEVFKMHQDIDIALSSVGVIEPGLPNCFYRDYLKKSELKELEKNNIVGETSFIFYDVNGKIYDLKLNERTMCISADNLLNIKNKILIAGGKFKTEAIIGAVRAGLVDTLIIDTLNLKRIVKLLDTI